MDAILCYSMKMEILVNFSKAVKLLLVQPAFVRPNCDEESRSILTATQQFSHEHLLVLKKIDTHDESLC